MTERYAILLKCSKAHKNKSITFPKYFLGTYIQLCQLRRCISTPSKPAIFQERNAGLKPRVREKSLIIGADIMGRDMDQNHGKHAKGHLLHLRIFIKAPQAAAQASQGTRDPASLLCTVLGRKLTGLMMPKNGGQPVAHSRHQLNARTRGTTISHYKMAFLQLAGAAR